MDHIENTTPIVAYTYFGHCLEIGLCITKYIIEFFELVLSPKFGRPLWDEHIDMREESEYTKFLRGNFRRCLLGRQFGFNIKVVRSGGGWNWLQDHIQWWA
jgi:hypothetical protein